ncbi:BppU family phage baseplate upper protein [Enterococcus faecium]|uniref:BppU family phage baseplate upper protein n=1 Tax=Enterococcus faecium TaxID=1352 RepID=UPI002019E7D0|nr:BppU family phage baseplate upper protein [Enterococcus faecium]UQQ90459.1 BppU family phage baseplate upper protein [Enterococcus faecium]
MAHVIKKGSIKVPTQPKDYDLQATGLVFKSYDNQIALEFNVEQQNGTPADLLGANLRLLMFIYDEVDGMITKEPIPFITKNLITESFLNGQVVYILPEAMKAYNGMVEAYVYIEYPDGSTSDNLGFTFRMKRSAIDGLAQDKADYFIADFQQLLDGVKQEATDAVNEALAKVEAVSKNVSSAQNDLTILEDRIDQANQKIDEVLSGANEFRTDIDTLKINKADKIDVNQALNQVNDRISNFPKGNPSGVYTTLADLKTAFPNGNSNIYVISEDGNWYYWSGSVWSSGGKYQETGIAENSIDGPKLMAETIQRHNLSETYVNGMPGANLFDKNNIHVDKYINYKFELADAAGYVTTNYIYISGQSKLTFKRITHYAFYDLSYTPIAFGTNSTLTTTTIDVPEGASYIIFSFSHNDTFPLDSYMCNYGDSLAAFETYGGKLTLENMESNLADKINSIPYGKIVEGIPSKNLLNSADFTIRSYVDPSTGKPVSSADYSSNFGKPIKVNGGQAYTIRNVTFYCFYDKNNQRLSGGSNGSNGELTINAPEDAANLVVSYPNSRANTAMVTSGYEIGEYESYGVKLTADVLPIEIRNQFSEPVKNISKTLIVDSSKTENAEDGVYTNLRTAFDSITDSAVNKQYEIIVYDNEINFEDLYPHANWHGGYYGLIAKDYVWITSADPDNPSKHLLKWDGHESLADDVNLTSAEAMAKSIMHVSKPNLTGAIDGFTLDVKNARYPFHFETAAAGNTWFKLKRCVLKWGGNPKVTGFQGATLGYGVSCGDHFSVEDCVITYTGEGHASTAGHNNGWDVSRMGPAPEVMPNARLTFKNCRFNNTGFRVDTFTSTDFDANRSYDIVTFENCKGIREYVFGLQGSATVSNWQSVKIGTV